MRQSRLLLGIALVGSLLLWQPAGAEGIVTTCDEAHLRSALAAGGTVTLACSGTITLTSPLEITQDTTLDGADQNVIVSGNHAVRVFSVSRGVTFNLNHLTVADGSADWGGGIFNLGLLRVSNCAFTGNSANWIYGGGAIDSRNTAGALTIVNSIFSGNSSLSDGGAVTNASVMTVLGSSFLDNSAKGDGGAIYNVGGNLEVHDSAFSGNEARAGGGIGVHTVNYERVAVSHSTFSGNRGSAGGAIYMNLGWLTVSNSTFHANEGGQGGALYADAEVTVINSTLSGNSAYEGGAIYKPSYSALSVAIENTIVADDVSGPGCAGYISDGGGNLSFPDATCPGIHSDPKLGPLQRNGGPTLTIGLLPGSAAVDAGKDATCASEPVNGRDQRGAVRPAGAHCDIGAFEGLSLSDHVYLPLAVKW